jgi:hypothetical protein
LECGLSSHPGHSSAAFVASLQLGSSGG